MTTVIPSNPSAGASPLAEPSAGNNPPAKKERHRYLTDIETLGTRPGSVCFEIAVVKFDDTGILAEFHACISPAEAKADGFTTDPATVDWWRTQSLTARATLDALLRADADGAGPLLTPRGTLALLAEFFQKHGTPTELWGNGPDFDNAHLQEAHQRVGRPVPWPYHANQSLRTAKLYLPRVDLPFEGVQHRALDDARHEVRTLLAMEAAERSRIAGLIAAAAAVAQDSSPALATAGKENA